MYQWSQFGELKGTLDGNNKTITLTIITSENIGNIGLFAKNSGTIKYLNLMAYIGSYTTESGWQNIGGFVGLNEGTIDRCNLESYLGKDNHCHFISAGNHFYDTDLCVSNKSTVRIGGIAGYNKGKITNCRNFGASISGSGDIGGIAGKSEGDGINSGYIYNSDNSGRIFYLWKEENRSVGGVVGYLASGTIDYCYNHAVISYDEVQIDSSEIKPAMGKIVGHSQGTVTRGNNGGTVDTGSLFKKTGFLGIVVYNQLEHAGDREIGVQN